MEQSVVAYMTLLDDNRRISKIMAPFFHGRNYNKIAW